MAHPPASDPPRGADATGGSAAAGPAASGAPYGQPHHPRPPGHLWPVGLLLVFWNGWSVAVAVALQTDRMPNMDPRAEAYFDAQPLWLTLLADAGALCGVAGAVALLLQSRWATRLFAAQLTVLALTNLYEVAVGTSPLLAHPGPVIASLVLVALLAGQIAYARAMTRRGVLY